MKKIGRWYQSLLKSIQLQLFISFISLPFLIGWGLPISIMTPISTLLFGPFLSCFLLVASLIFFFELFYLPNTWFISCLEIITSTWLMCLNLEQRSWLIGIPKPPIIVLLFIPCIALTIIHSKKLTTIKLRILFLGFFLIGTCTALKLFPYRYEISEKIPCHKGEITLLFHNDTLTILDPGYLAAKPSYESYIAYTLLPEIVQKTGRMSIDHLIIGKFNKRILDALQFLATKIRVTNLYLPAWQGTIPLFAWHSYVKLKKAFAAENGKVIPISFKKQINIDTKTAILIEPIAIKEIKYYDAIYHTLSVKNIADNTQYF